MSPVRIEESGLTFGPYEDDDCFPVEKSALFSSIGEGVKTVEFLLLRRGRAGRMDLFCVEAKTTSPHPQGRERFDEFCTEIRDKMLAALLLFLSARLGRHGAAGDELPAALRALPLDTMGVRFVLVVTTARDEWLVPLQDALRTRLLPILRAFRIDPASVAVLNEARARAAGLVS